MYSTLWTQFETQALAYGLLRKALYPTYLVRGYLGKLVIYKPTADKRNPVQLLTINVSASESKDQCGFFKKGEKEYLLVGGDDCWNLADRITSLLAAGEGQATPEAKAIPSPV